ncbi:hypothetical protein B9479_008388, partial [Cryptococcus floricola]
MNLALATHHPETVPDSPIDNRSLDNDIDADTSEQKASQWYEVSKKMQGCRQSRKRSTKKAAPAANAAVSDGQDQGVGEEEDEEGEDGEENGKQGGDRRDEDDRNPDGKPGGAGGCAPGAGGGASGAGGGASGAGNGSGDPGPNGGRPNQSRPRSDHDQESSSKRQKKAHVSGPTEYLLPPPKSMIATSTPSPSSFSEISSCFENEHPVSVEEWFLSVRQKASTDRMFNDTDIPRKPIIYTAAEKVLPREYWTHAEYLDSFSGLGVNFVLATPTEVDVLLARAAKFGWVGALGRG